MNKMRHKIDNNQTNLQTIFLVLRTQPKTQHSFL